MFLTVIFVAGFSNNTIFELGDFPHFKLNVRISLSNKKRGSLNINIWILSYLLTEILLNISHKKFYCYIILFKLLC